jgi:AbrB family looped-hinge helix DNA binding protein
MAAKVGPKGQVVISKEIRDRLGVKPGWRAIQQLVGDHVEVYFIPPEHDESLKGILAPYIQARVLDEEWHRIKQEAWEEAACEAANQTPSHESATE